MDIRKMTAEEKRGKAVCIDCKHCTSTKPDSEFYCLAKLDRLFNYITGEVEEDAIEDKHNCAHYNGDGNCEDFEPIKLERCIAVGSK